MKKIVCYMLLALPLVFSCQQEKDGPAVSKMKGTFYPKIEGANGIIELSPGKSKVVDLRAMADTENGSVSDCYLTMTFKAAPEAVETYNAAHGTHYEMFPGSAYDFGANLVMMPRYGVSSTTTKLKVTASGLEAGKEYLLPVTIDKVTGTDNWALSEGAVAYVTMKQTDVDPDKGDGSAALPYILSTPEDMMKMSELVIEKECVYFKMGADIDMKDVDNWIPFNAGSPYDYLVDFDGDGHTIDNFHCDYSSYPSFFGVLYGTVHDVNFTNAVITATTGQSCGIVAGYCGTTNHHAEAKNVHVQGKVTGSSKTGVGGMFGVIQDAVVSICSADCEVSSSANYVGGLFGYEKSPAEVHDCWTSGSVEGPQRVGGICGGLIQTDNGIYNCYSLSSVTAGFAIGGIAGHCNQDQKAGTPTESKPNDTIEKCIAWNQFVRARTMAPGTNDHYSVGAIAGFTSCRNNLTDCMRRPDLDFQDYTDLFPILDQPNATSTSPLGVGVFEPYQYPYHGKAAPSGSTLSDVAKSLGWSAEIWDFSGPYPAHKGSNAPAEIPEVTPGGQLPDFGENEFYK